MTEDNQNEGKEKENGQPEETNRKSDEGDKPETLGIVERAGKERQELEKLYKNIKEEREKIEELKATEIMGGQTQSGQRMREQDEDPVTYAKNALAGKFNK